MNNRLGNVHNKYQTDEKKVLCLCSAGMLRSPTVANVLHSLYGYNTRAAGVTDDFALIPVDEILCVWADEIVVVDSHVRGMFTFKFGEGYNSKITQLNIPDIYEWNDAKLIEIIKEQYANE